ncbi:mycothiol transferase [Mycobacteroides salmoniphilum]|uniref:mycothiol transferase n=1 Tax=Mycobacteroides salmoniphilum TaxID=404941 RepID=UPI0009927E76|nr:mycothiol transferase [Mycobacteroides salmoniphilum]QCH25692.1 DinB superfamily protein [Mycobacteroides salmoniphilum]
MTDLAAAASARELLRDSFTRIIEHVREVTDGLPDSWLTYRPTPDANSIAWLIWHSARCQDAQICAITGDEPLWTARGWEPRFGLDLPADSNGYGHTPQDVAKVVATVDLLSGYYGDVHEMTLRYIESLTDSGLARVVDSHWDPPVTASVRLVSIVDDCAQHLGQAAYLRGIAPTNR